MNKQLLDEMQNAVKETISDKKIGVAFSGGVDSTLLAKLVKDMGYDIHLLTIGFQDSHDINFAKEVNQILSFPHSVSEIDPEKFKQHKLPRPQQITIHLSQLSLLIYHNLMIFLPLRFRLYMKLFLREKKVNL